MLSFARRLPESIFQDIRIGLRGFRRNLSFSATAVLVIALGIGAGAAVSSFVDRVLFRSLPYPDSHELVSVGVTIPWMDGEFLMANDYLHLREHMQIGFSALASWTGVADCDLSEENPERLACAQTDSWFLPTFRIAPLLGRNFTEQEDRPDVPKVALLSYGLWRSRFAGDAAVLGKTIQVDGMKTEIIGVLPPTFEFPNLAHVDLLVPQAVRLLQYRPGESGRPLRVFGRLKNGVTAAQARSVVSAYLLEGWRQIFSAEQMREVHIVVRSLRDYQIQDVRLASWLLVGATAGMLLIVCANIANLWLARSNARRADSAMRAALGASRGRLWRQAFTESSVLCGFGAALGCGLAWVLVRIFQRLAPMSIPRLQQSSLDAQVLAFIVLVALVCAIVFSLPAALGSSKTEPLAAGSRITGARSNRGKQLLMMGQVAVSMVLLPVAVLLIESLVKLQSVAPGIAIEHVVTADITVPPSRYPNTMARQQFFELLADRLRRMRGIEAVAISDTAPPTGFVHTRPLKFFQVSGALANGSQSTGIVAWRSVSRGYFLALNIPILRGRGFEKNDYASDSHVMIVSASLMHRLFGDQDPIGRTLRMNRDSPPFTVIGVARDVKNEGLAQPPDPEYYIPRKEITDPNVGRDESIVSRSLHIYDGEAFLIVRGDLPVRTVAQWIRSQAGALDPLVPVTISSMEQQLHGLAERPRFTAALLSFFAFVCVALVAAGLYGLTSFMAVQRTHEAGVRMALGAMPSGIAVLMMKQAMRWTAAGMIVGAIASCVAVRLLHSLFFHAAAGDPALWVGTALLMLLVALAAAWLPAKRAAGIDPIAALRHE